MKKRREHGNIHPCDGVCPVIVVGIGASAGGLDSLKRLFAGIEPGHGAAFVVIQHLDPAHENLTVKFLAALTKLTVVEASDGMPVLADRVHVIPPNRLLSISQCSLRLTEAPHCSSLRRPIDHFLCSLADDQRQRACGILLSGTGSDGTMGLSEIHAAGGRTIAEDPAGAKFPGMPQSAIAAGAVDAILRAEAMPPAILEWCAQVAAKHQNDDEESPEFDADLRAILAIVRAKIGHDFQCYKPNTPVRRIRRRMTLAKVATYGDYVRFLQEHPEEVELLRKDLLIGITEFFRQPEAWDLLEEKVISPLVANAQPGSEIRVWVPGCSTGQEAYTLAILLTEQAQAAGRTLAVEIFATDTNDTSLAIARNGSYTDEEVVPYVSPERVKRFFERHDGRYRVIKELRGKVVFAPQDLMADPPFSKLDLISCRNLFIYLDQQVQKKIVALFHFALKAGGFLFLGSAETIGDRQDLFEPVSKKWRLYRRIGVGRRLGVEIPVRSSDLPKASAGKTPAPSSGGDANRSGTPRLSLASTAEQLLMERFAPACVMIDRKLQVVYVHGSVGEYLTFPPGELSNSVVDMAREGLRARLRGAIGKSIETGKPVSVTARVRRGSPKKTADGKSVAVKVGVSPLKFPREADGLLLITFEDMRVAASASRARKAADGIADQLEDELKVTREELQSTIEQLENSNDALKGSNEEVTAANEELQSANEEMETSKEELQSLNEELNTINVRLQEKVDELESTNNDVVNLLSSTSIATVFLDKDFNVKRYTPAVTALFSLIPSDAGRPIADVLRRFSDESLLDQARGVLVDLTPASAEVRADDGRWFIRRITPYRTHDDRIEGVVITFVDVAELKRAQLDQQTAAAAAAAARDRLANVLDSITDAYTLLDDQWRFVEVNAVAAQQAFGKPAADLVGKVIWELFPQAVGGDVYTQYHDAVATGKPVHFEAKSRIRDKWWEIHAYPRSGRLEIYMREITARKGREDELRKVNRTLKALSRGDQAVLRAENEAEFLAEICRIIVVDCGHAMVWIGYAEDDEGKTVRPVASAGFEEGYLDTLRVTWADTERGRGPTGTAIRTGKPCGCANMLMDPAFAPWRAEAIKRGYASSLVLPLMAGEKAFGAITLYSAKRDAFTADEVELLSALAGDVAHAITTLRLRAANRVAEEALRQLNAQLERRVAEQTEEIRRKSAYNRRLIEASLDPLVTIGADGKITDANAASEQATGFDREELIGTDFSTYFTEPAQARAGYRQAFKDGLVFDYPLEIRHRDGHTIPVLYNAVVYRDETGKVVGVFAAARDITETRKAQAALQKANETLERGVAERTMELAESEAQLAAVLDLAPVAMWIAHDPRCRKITGNRYADELIMQVSRGANISASAKPGEAGVTYKAVRNGVALKPEELPAQVAATTGKPVPAQMLDLVFSNGRVVHMFMGAMPLLDAEGAVRGSVAAGTDVTPLKQAEESLMKNQATLQGILDATQESIWLFSADGVVQLGNGIAFARLGKPASELVGKTIAEIVPPDVARLRMQKLRDVVTSSQPVEFEDERSGMLFRHSFYPILDAERRVTAVVSFSSDITERKKAEEALHIAHERVAFAQQSAGAGSWEWDMMTGKLDWSPELFLLFGLDPAKAEATFDRWRDIMHPDDRQAAGERVEAAVRDHTKLHNEYRIVLPSGIVRWINAVGETTYDEAGKAIRMAGLCLDITARKAAEDAVRASEERLRFALETSRIGAWDLDLTDHSAFRSAEHDRIFGYPELLPQWTYEMFLDHVIPEDRAGVDGAFRRAMESGGDWNFECRIRRKDAEIRWIWGAGRHSPDAAGGSRRMAGIVQDITERKQAEDEIRRRAEELRAANEELSTFNRMAVGRELRMVELKKQVNELCAKAGLPERYDVEFEQQGGH